MWGGCVFFFRDGWIFGVGGECTVGGFPWDGLFALR